MIELCSSTKVEMIFFLNAPQYFSQVLEESKSKATPCQPCDLKETIYLTII